MIDRNKLAEELVLREHVRKAIKFVIQKREVSNRQKRLQEEALRSIVRDLIIEAKKIAVYDSTGKNELNVYLLNSTFRSTLETSYRKLTTTPQQRSSYIEHMIVFVNEFLKRLDSLAEDDFARDEKPEEPEEEEDSIKIDMGGEEEIESEETTVSLGPEEMKFADLYKPGSDMTGARAAYSAFMKETTSLRDSYSNLDNSQDQADFRNELPRQIIFYTRQYENSLRAELGAKTVSDLDIDVGGGIPVPMSPDGSTAAPEDPGTDVGQEGGEAEEGSEDLSDIPEFELQEVIKHLNIDDIIENLL